MEKSVAVLIGMAGLAVMALVAFACYQWRQRKRERQVKERVKEFLVARYGELPTRLSINCSDDPLWPVLVAFDNPGGGIRRSLQFNCPGNHPTPSLLTEKEETL